MGCQEGRFHPPHCPFLEGRPTAGHSPALRKQKKSLRCLGCSRVLPKEREFQTGCCWCRLSRRLGPQSPQLQSSPTLQVSSDREVIPVKHHAPLGQQILHGFRVPCPEPYSDQGDTFPFSGYILGTAPKLGQRRRVSEKPGLLSWGGGGVALVHPQYSSLRPPPQPHKALA